MSLETIDWIIIIGYLFISLFIGLYFRKQAGKSLTDYFLSGRKLPWYIAGISMVATTFAADTPLAVTELVGKNGISGNWLWWNMLMGGMLTTFFFSKLWRRANILTEAEFIELRYSGKAAKFLRGFKALYLGLFMNVLIIAWVNLALATLIQVFFDVPQSETWRYIGLAMLITALYSALSGLWGVAITDVVQFVLAMTGSIVLAVLVVQSEKIGGITGLKEQLPDWSLNFFPQVGMTSNVGTTLSITFASFFAYLTIWFMSWYPGAEPGGGGYIAQRMMSARSEKDSVWATLFFQIGHYCIRPWPWILVALACIILYPELDNADKKLGYVMAMKEFLPVGLKGLMLAAFLAAYMSTISTQLNWGASYIVNDLYKRFIIKDKNDEYSEKKYVTAGRITTIIIMVIALIVTQYIETISGVWSFIIECGAGLGLVLILRWLWWRINAWSEITATIAPFIAYAISKFVLNLEFPNSFFVTIGFTTIAWLVVTYISSPEKNETLSLFYNKIKPLGNWSPFTNSEIRYTNKKELAYLIAAWLSATIMTYASLFFIGDLLLNNMYTMFIWGAIGVVSFAILYFAIQKSNLFD
jgi:Na+/proline symporter